MKKTKLILLLTLFAGQLLCMDQLTGLVESLDAPVQGNMQANAMNQVFSNQDSLEMILCEAGPNFKMAAVSKSWNQVFKRRYQFLESLGLSKVKSLQLLWYKDFEDLYVKLVRQTGRLTTKPETGVINKQVLLELVQEVKDVNLFRAWPKMRKAIVAATPAVKEVVPAKNATPGQIRDWLYNKENQEVIRQEVDLALLSSGLTCLPEEVSLFAGLRMLIVQDSQLEEVVIPNTLTALQTLWLLSNKLKKVIIPGTLTALQELNLVNNKLTEVSIPTTLTALRSLRLGNNELTELTVPDTLTALEELWLLNNRLTPELIRIPDAIRQRASIMNEGEQRPAADS